jgi:hypothetical protein
MTTHHRENFIWAGLPVAGSRAAQKVITLVIDIIKRGARKSRWGFSGQG